jgi:anti-sigma-K factor RskA
MENNVQYSRKEMEERLPDYVFDRLGDEERNKFEQSLPNYPDLIKEVSDVRTVFTKVRKIDFNKIAEAETRGMTERVLSRLHTQNRTQTTYNYARTTTRRYLIPALAAIVLIAFATQFIVWNISKEENMKNNQIVEKIFDNQAPKVLELSQKDIATLDKSVAQCSAPILLENELPEWNNSNELADLIDDIYSEYLTSFTNESNTQQVEYVVSTINYGNNYFNDLNNLDEENLQNILNEVDNAEFIF